MDDFARQYRDFFKESQAGQRFVEQLNSLIERNHEKGEEDMDHARDYMQRAAGIREAVTLVNMLTTEAKKPMQQ